MATPTDALAYGPRRDQATSTGTADQAAQQPVEDDINHPNVPRVPPPLRCGEGIGTLRLCLNSLTTKQNRMVK